jgi:hypothetical protein
MFSYSHQGLYNDGKSTCPIFFKKIFLILIEFSDENNKISINYCTTSPNITKSFWEISM